MDPAKDTKDVFQVRAELYASSRFPPKAYELFRTRALVTDVIAQQCWLYVRAIARLHERINTARNGMPRVGIIGGGHIGCAIAMALLTHDYPSDKIVLSTRQLERVPNVDALASSTSQTLFQTISRVYDNAALSKECDVLILCVPPPQLKSVVIQIKHALAVADSRCVVITVLCGVPVETVQKACGTRLVLRTAVDIQDITKRLQDGDGDQDDQDRGEPSVDVLLMLRQLAEAIAASQLDAQKDVVRLAHVLLDLASRLDPQLTLPRATETVAAVLRDDRAKTPSTQRIDDTTKSAPEE